MAEANITDTHFHQLASQLTSWIYSFHMYNFMALSGGIYGLQKNREKIQSFSGLFANKMKRLLIPFFGVWIFWNIPIKLLTGYYNGVSPVKALLQMLFPANVYLWYLESLFLIFLIAYAVLKLKNKILQIILAFISWCIGFILFRKLSLFHILGDPLYYFPWFYIGYHAETIIGCLQKMKLWKASVIVTLFAADIILFLIVEYINIKIIQIFGKYILLPFIMFIVLHYIIRNTNFTEKGKRKLKAAVSYGFGVYLYAEPLNYLFLYIMYRVWGIQSFGSEAASMLLYFSRIGFTPVAAIFIVWIFKTLGLKDLY